MALPPAMSEHPCSDAERLAVAITTAVQVAVDVSLGRARDPGSFPIIGPDPVGEMARKILGDLVELGLTPDGWQVDFFGPATDGWRVAR